MMGHRARYVLRGEAMVMRKRELLLIAGQEDAGSAWITHLGRVLVPLGTLASTLATLGHPTTERANATAPPPQKKRGRRHAR